MLFQIWDSTYKLVEFFFFNSELIFLLSFHVNLFFYFDMKSLMQSTGTLALNGLSSSPERTEILAVDQLGAVQRRGHVAHSKNCSWPSGVILSRVSLDGDFL